MTRITNEQQVLVSVDPRTVGGNEAPIDGEAQFNISPLGEEQFVAEFVRQNDRSGFIVARNPGIAQLVVTLDADLGEGVRTMQATGVIEVVPAEATTIEITFGTPQQQPPAE